MESRIKVKATYARMEQFASLVGVRYCEDIKFIEGDKKRRHLFKVTLRHSEDVGPLKGTYNVETLFEMFHEEAYDEVKWDFRKFVIGIKEDLEAIGKKDSLVEVLNDALSIEGLTVSKIA